MLYRYSVITKLLHWVSAILVIILFSLGYWMVELSYYDTYYHIAPYWHRSLGVMLCALTFLRLCYNQKNTNYKNTTAKIVQYLLYFGLVALFITGYCVSTIQGKGFEVFFIIPIPTFFVKDIFSHPESADIIGLLHQYIAYALILLVIVHFLAAMKHHYIDKDDTLNRMWFFTKK